MAGTAISFDHSGVRIIGRDDGTVGMEFVDDDREVLEGTAAFSPDEAINIGKLMVAKGTALKEQAQALVDDSPAWVDCEGRVWYGPAGSNRMYHPDAPIHSWAELVRAYGPLSAVGK